MTQFKAHNSATTVAKFSPSGFYVASADEGGNVKVWDAVGDDSVIKGEFPVISGRINDVAWDADSKRIIAVGNGKERFGHCFTFDSGNTVGEISGHSAQISAVAIKPTRPFRAATVSDDAGLVFLSAPPYKFISSVRNHHSNFIRDVEYSPDGKYIVSVGSDKKIVVYDGASGEFVKEIADSLLPGSVAHDSGIFGVSWVHQKPTQFVTCSTDATVKVWDVATGEVVSRWELPRVVENQQLGVVSTPDYIISLSFDGNLNYFTADEKAPVKVIRGHQKSITALTVAGEKLFSGSYDGRIVQWDLNADGAAQYIQGSGHSNLVTDLVSHKTAVISGGWDDIVAKIENLKFDESQEIKLAGQPLKISSVNSHGLYGLVTSDGVLRIVDSASNKEVAKKELGFEASTVDVDDSIVVVGDDKSYNVHFFHIKDLSAVPGHALKATYKPSYLSISPDGQYLAVGDTSGKIVLYSVANKAIQTSRWAFHTSKINSIAWRSDSKYVVSGSLDTNIIVYSVDKPVRNVKALNTHKDGVNKVVWVDDSTIVSGGNDSAIKFWDVKLT